MRPVNTVSSHKNLVQMYIYNPAIKFTIVLEAFSLKLCQELAEGMSSNLLSFLL